MEFGDKLSDLMLSGVASLAGALLPVHWRRQAKARLSDFNPFDVIHGNQDLTRAVRLAWIEAALKVLDAARASRARSGNDESAVALHDFINTAERDLRRIRHEALDRRGDVGRSPIDTNVKTVLQNAPAFVGPDADHALAEPLTRSFTETLAAITGWRHTEIPALPGQIAQSGLLTVDSSVSRSFGELVFASFAELLKDPKNYPEAGAAFAIAMQDAARKLVGEALTRLEGIDTKLDEILAGADAGRVIGAGATEYLSLLPELLEGQTQLQRKVDSLAKDQAVEGKRAEERHAERLATGERHHREQIAQQARIAELLAQERGVPLAILQAQLGRLGEVEVPFDRIDARLDAFVTEFLKLKEDLAKSTSADSELANTRVRALALLNDGDLEGARTLYSSMLATIRGRRQQVASEEAALLADRARIDLLQVRYDEAIAAYEDAANLVYFDTEAARHHLRALAYALTAKGRDLGDRGALGRAVDILRTRILPSISRTQLPLEWASAQNDLGIALRRLGEGGDGTSRLEEAEVAFRAALEEWTRKRDPLNWAAAQNNLGNVLTGMAEHETGTERLNKAVCAYRAALKERTRRRVPLDWAATLNNLGTALAMLGTRNRTAEVLEEAVRVFGAALEVRTQQRWPLDWAATQSNLGKALTVLGKLETGTTRFYAAVAACRAALKERTRDRLPLEWAMTQTNLADALTALGQREAGVTHFKEAVTAYREALKERTRERVPAYWAPTQRSLGNVLYALAGRTGQTAYLKEAVETYRSALEIGGAKCMTELWAATQSDLGDALFALAEREGGIEHAKEAVLAYQAALRVWTRESAPEQWANLNNNLGGVLWIWGERAGVTAHLEEAIDALELALELLPSQYSDIVQANVNKIRQLIAGCE